jgi:hypothetical protein
MQGSIMVIAVSQEPSVSSPVNALDYRYRPAMGERTILPDSTAKAPGNSAAGENGSLPKPDRDLARQPELPQKENSAIFVAAVISGALSPTPQTMDELITRIGTSPIPEELEARLKDLLA